MKVKVLREAGYDEAMLGLSLSFEKDPKDMGLVAAKLYNKDNGENKFLESMIVWLDITAPRYWWSQADTYRHATKQSGSTMHTLMKRPLTIDDFEGEIHPEILDLVNEMIAEGNLAKAKAHLPESFLQRRIVCTSYSTLRRIISQRKNHKLREWHAFIESILSQVKFPEFLKEE